MKYKIGDRVFVSKTRSIGVVTEVHEDHLVVVNSNMEEAVVLPGDRIFITPPSPRKARFSKLRTGDVVKIALLADAMNMYKNNIPTYLLRFLGTTGTVVAHDIHLLTCLVKVDDVIIWIHEDLLTKEGDVT